MESQVVTITVGDSAWAKVGDEIAIKTHRKWWQFWKRKTYPAVVSEVQKTDYGFTISIKPKNNSHD